MGCSRSEELQHFLLHCQFGSIRWGLVEQWGPLGNPWWDIDKCRVAIAMPSPAWISMSFAQHLGFICWDAGVTNLCHEPPQRRLGLIWLSSLCGNVIGSLHYMTYLPVLVHRLQKGCKHWSHHQLFPLQGSCGVFANLFLSTFHSSDLTCYTTSSYWRPTNSIPMSSFWFHAEKRGFVESWEYSGRVSSCTHKELQVLVIHELVSRGGPLVYIMPIVFGQEELRGKFSDAECQNMRHLYLLSISMDLCDMDST